MAYSSGLVTKWNINIKKIKFLSAKSCFPKCVCVFVERLDGSGGW